MNNKMPLAIGVISIVSTLASLTLFLASMWQIEMIWVAMQNGWAYALPFNSHKSFDWWAWHDLWFTIQFISWLMIAVPQQVIALICVMKYCKEGNRK